MDYNDYYRNTTNHGDEQQEIKNPNQLDPKKAIKGYIFIVLLIAVILGLYFLNEKLDKKDNTNSNSNSNSNVVSNG